MIGLGVLAALFLALAVLLAFRGGQWYVMIAFSLIPVALAGLFSWNERWWQRAVVRCVTGQVQVSLVRSATQNGANVEVRVTVAGHQYRVPNATSHDLQRWRAALGIIEHRVYVIGTGKLPMAIAVESEQTRA
jgi:hypothetical protein